MLNNFVSCNSIHKTDNRSSLGLHLSISINHYLHNQCNDILLLIFCDLFIRFSVHNGARNSHNFKRCFQTVFTLGHKKAGRIKVTTH